MQSPSHLQRKKSRLREREELGHRDTASEGELKGMIISCPQTVWLINSLWVEWSFLSSSQHRCHVHMPQAAHLPWAGHSTWIISFNSPSTLWGLSPFHRWKNWVPERWLTQTQLFESLSVVTLGQKGEWGGNAKGQKFHGGRAQNQLVGTKPGNGLRPRKKLGGQCPTYSF